ncbi:MAG: hypothetical protein JSS53_03210 [Proteobacteria bacterium]|nr:hypothetical protein [Pseudomonadota bacterium]
MSIFSILPKFIIRRAHEGAADRNAFDMIMYAVIGTVLVSACLLGIVQLFVIFSLLSPTFPILLAVLGLSALFVALGVAAAIPAFGPSILHIIATFTNPENDAAQKNSKQNALSSANGFNHPQEKLNNDGYIQITEGLSSTHNTAPTSVTNKPVVNETTNLQHTPVENSNHSTISTAIRSVFMFFRGFVFRDNSEVPIPLDQIDESHSINRNKFDISHP